MVRLLRLLRWILFFEGWILLSAPAVVVHWASQLDAILPQSRWTPDNYLAWLTAVSWLAGSLCLATFWGMGAQKPWVRATGLAVSLFNLAIFPPLGLTGLIAMRRFAKYNIAEDADQDTLVEETQIVRISRISATLVLLVVGYRWIDSFSATLGVGGSGFGWQTILLILCGQVLVALSHDAGHNLAAVAFGLRFPIFRLGPWAWTQGAGRGSIHVHPGRLFSHDSYLGGIPTNPVHVRWDLVAAAAAGPVSSLLIGLALFLAMLHSPGTVAASDGQFMGILALLFALDFSMQILPFGYSDGRILVDLLAYNRRGRNMVLQMTAAVLTDVPAQTTGSLANLATAVSGPASDPVHPLRDNLNMLLRRGVVGGNELAQTYLNLGIGEVLTGRFGAAREHLERSIDLLDALPHHAAPGTTWMWIEKLNRSQQRGVESHYAYGRAVQCWEKAKEKASKMPDVVEAHLALAALHLSQGELGSCMEALEQAEPHLPTESAYLLLCGRFHQTAAVCGFRMRWTERSRIHALAAAKAYTNKNFPSRGLGLLRLGDLATELWHAGQSALATEFLAQAIGGLSSESDATSWLRLQRAEILAKTGQRSEALTELDNIQNPNAEQELRIASILGWGSLLGGRYLDAVEYFATAASTLDQRDRARQEVAQARAWYRAGRYGQAVGLARSACDVLMREEHGEAGMGLLLIAADEFRNDAHLTTHPFFEEGCRIVRAARFFPLPDKWVGLQDIIGHFENLGRKLEAGEIREEMQRIEAQMTWDIGTSEVAPSKAS